MITLFMLASLIVAILIVALSLGTFWSGRSSPIKWTPAAAAEVNINVVDHSWKEAVDRIDITHTGTLGIQALLASILRGSGNVKAFLDTSGTLTYYSSVNQVRAGTKGLLKHYLTPTLFFTIPAMIVEVNSAVPVGGGVAYDFTVELDAEASATVYSYPV